MKENDDGINQIKSQQTEFLTPSVAEAAHSSIKGAGERNLSLVDAVHADITASEAVSTVAL